MKDILKRDITGDCVGECRNTVREAEQRRQKEINKLQAAFNRKHSRKRKS